MAYHRFEQFQDMLYRLYPELHAGDDSSAVGDYKLCKLTRTVTLQVTEACNLQCSYCYQINKGCKKMSFEVAKKLIDKLLRNDESFNGYINCENSPGIILEFIGGEPLLEVDLIEQICDYFFEQAVLLEHPWATKCCISITSNGTLYFTPNVQRFLQKYKGYVSFSVTLDGNKELHDMCRKFPDGRPSYDLAEAAVKDWMQRGLFMGSKVTLSPQNISYMYEAFVNMVNLNYTEIMANVVYEKGWEAEHATIMYEQQKKIADYILDNDLENKLYCSLFEAHIGAPMEEYALDNWCGGTDLMLAMDSDGNLYPCLRYMETSLGPDVEPIVIGHVDRGIYITEKEQQVMKCMSCITRRTQSTDKCFYCPIASGCGWCSAYNYQELGSPDARCTYICQMHQARVLANTYFWNKYFRKMQSSDRLKVHCPKEWALEFISEEEYDFLVEYSKEGD